jgi:hypothetical protein
MVPAVSSTPIAKPTTALLAAMIALAGCGAGAKSSSTVSASADPSPRTCAATVLEALSHVAMRLYREGVSSERTAAAKHFIGVSAPLRQAVERADAQAARTAAEALVATGQMTSLRIIRGGQVLADVGSPDALAPLHGTLLGAHGATIGTFKASVWSDEGFLAETGGVTEGKVALRANGQSIAGSFALPPGELPAQGTLTVQGTAYQYASFPAKSYPSGSLRIYVLRTIRSTAPRCGARSEDTVAKTLSRIATLIYTGETGGRARVQVRRVQDNPALLRAVARRDPAATSAAVESLLNQHIVRLRVSDAGGKLLADVGGPDVLAPQTATLHLGGRTIGSFVLSIQDDEGYKRLAGRLAGLPVLMYMGSQLVKNSLGANPGTVPASGSYRYRGHDFRVFTLHAAAFPSGPLTIRVLIPIPYS